MKIREFINEPKNHVSLYDCFVTILIGYLVIMPYTQHMLFLCVDNVTDVVFSRVLATGMEMSVREN